ncbi:AAA family ATPase [Companilactobacillus mishanensis]|uniref:AAA family ATPase n=1 Tax=Companilactobacillus mishanensis TaxID=2486008 RepID=A0A5P0ZEZ8_9LACO|nr:AAA family ATPase [Companilactobacillus mishanensis]MQS44270.1 AAA family ATPase [Companilactobacillus mishanensis]MQS51627.1 AAA family ATPase [Companilactobacillus mishanensis]
MESLGAGMREAIEEIKKRHNITVDLDNIDAVREQRQKQSQIDITNRFIKQERERMFRSSIISDREDLGQTFEQFMVNTSQQQKELAMAENIAQRINHGERGNFTFSGNPGAGKTMLAISILNYLNSQQNSLTCLFVSVSIFMQMKMDAQKSYIPQVKDEAYKLEQLIKRCDVLVLDDLGSESTLQENENGQIPQAYDSVQRHLFRIADYRVHKTNIITTNNSSKELQKIYNSKIYSRLIAKKRENVIPFISDDMRNV